VLKKDTLMTSKNDKLKSRIWIGFLVGYKFHNVWLIYYSSTDIVYAVRDVAFDEKRLFRDMSFFGRDFIVQNVKQYELIMHLMDTQLSRC